ncbi:hypothetical protein NHG22_25380 [Streptomyces sp. ATE26]|nr:MULTISPECIES: hypothetical protein [unclassified Streptomyces]MDI1457111.1 hypothetical protein [Streptomyces sp. ATE26]
MRDQRPREVTSDFLGSGLQGRQGDGLIGLGTQGEGPAEAGETGCAP